MIPRKLHLIWMGERPLPEWANLWLEMYQHWEVRLWDEQSIWSLPLVNRPAFDWYASRGRWNGAADVARVEILYRHGGVYVDVDAIPLVRMDDAPFMDKGFFAGLVSHMDRLANGTIGAEAHHPILGTYMAMIGKVKKKLPPSRTVGSVLLTQAVGCHADRDDIAILPPKAFYPETKSGRPAPGEGIAYMKHLWAGSNHRYDT